MGVYDIKNLCLAFVEIYQTFRSSYKSSYLSVLLNTCSYIPQSILKGAYWISSNIAPHLVIALPTLR